jgi:hypothetical protein
VKRPLHLSLVRHRVIRGATVADLAARLEELERGVGEHSRMLPALETYLDELEPALAALVERREPARGRRGSH